MVQDWPCGERAMAGPLGGGHSQTQNAAVAESDGSSSQQAPFGSAG